MPYLTKSIISYCVFCPDKSKQLSQVAVAGISAGATALAATIICAILLRIVILRIQQTRNGQGTNEDTGNIRRSGHINPVFDKSHNDSEAHSDYETIGLRGPIYLPSLPAPPLPDKEISGTKIQNASSKIHQADEATNDVVYSNDDDINETSNDEPTANAVYVDTM